MTKKNGRNYPAQARQKAEKMMSDGKSVKEVADHLGITVGAVAYWKSKMSLKGKGKVTDVLALLKHARTAIMKGAQAGRKPTRAEIYVLLALDELEGG